MMLRFVFKMLRIDVVFIWLIVNLCLLSGTLTNFLDLEELKSVNYDIDIREKPVLYGRPLHNEVVYLSSKYGQKYECQLPDVTDVGKEQEETKMAADTGISELLKPMESSPCLIKTKDWWSYEFCYGKYVRQFHMENNKIVGEIINLGFYESEMDWNNKSHSAANRHRLNRYHSHRYVNGTTCDLTNKPREAEVRFMCAEGQLDSVSRIDEPESCHYVVTVHTMRICHHPYLKPTAAAKPKNILCFPLLQQEQYEQYMRQQMINKYTREAQEFEDEGNEEAEGGHLDEDDKDPQLLEEHYSEGQSPDKDVDKGLTSPGQLADLLSGLAENVQSTLSDINAELSDVESTMQKHDDSEGVTSLLQGDDDEEEEEEDDEEDEDDAEMQKLLEKDYKELIAEFGKLAGQDTQEAQRLQTIAKSIEMSFENIDAMEKLLEDMQEKISIDKELNQDATTEQNNMETETGTEGGTPNSDETKTGAEEEDTTSVVNKEKEDVDKDDEEEEEDEDTDEKKDLEKHMVDTINKMIRQLRAKDKAGGGAGKLTSPASQQETSTDLSGRVRVRVTRVKYDKNQKASSEKELKFYDTEHRNLEDAISEQLEKTGLKAEGGGQIELRVLSYVPEDWPDQGTEDDGIAILSEEESTYFRNMIVGLVMPNDAQEQQRHQRLEKNYQFHWDPNQNQDWSSGPQGTSDQDQVQTSSSTLNQAQDQSLEQVLEPDE